MKKFFAAFAFAWNGLKAAFLEEVNLKFHVGAALAAIAAGFYFKVTEAEWLAIILTIAIVILTELINTAIEGLVDLVSPERNSLAGKVKDISAAAVLISAVAAVIVALVIFPKYII
jgi:diacylglycerol kinase